ncbi:hypothetical protein BH09MYX1_BH09MYX1_24250 [soil metagenome]
MFLVAVIALGSSVEAEAPALAADLGQTAYEARLLLVDDPPSVVLRAPEREKALALVASLRGRGHDVVACDAAAVVPFASMIEVDAFTDDGTTLHCGEAELPWADVAAMIRVTLRRTWQTTKKETKRELAVGMAIATGGVILSKKVTKTHTENHENREQLLCVFRRNGPPWIVAETGVEWSSVPGELGRTVTENFDRLVAHFRARTTAPYDDRFVRSKRVANDRAAVQFLEERVHLLALALAKKSWNAALPPRVQ